MEQSKQTTKPKGVTNADLQEAISEEIADLVTENRDLIVKRAHKRLRAKFKKV